MATNNEDMLMMMLQVYGGCFAVHACCWVAWLDHDAGLQQAASSMPWP